MLNLTIKMPSISLPQSITSSVDCDEDKSYQCHIEDDTNAAAISTPNNSPKSIEQIDTKSEYIEEVVDDEIDLDDCLLNTDWDQTPILAFLQQLQQNDEQLMLAKHGYQTIHKVCDTLQGELFKAKVIKLTMANLKRTAINAHVAIKKVCKLLTAEKTAEDKEDGTLLCVEENIMKEAVILKHLTVDNHMLGNYVVRFVDFFESDTHYYLVTEYVNGMTLKEFIHAAVCNLSFFCDSNNFAQFFHIFLINSISILPLVN